MNHSNKKHPSRDWLLRMAEVEDASRSVAVGGVAADFEMVRPQSTESHCVFGRLIEYARRAKNLSVEELADRADVDLAEVVDIERHEDAVPAPRTVYQLATVLELPAGMLAEVAGLAKARGAVSEAALRFAARSEPTATLSKAEREALEEFVKVLVEASNGG